MYISSTQHAASLGRYSQCVYTCTVYTLYSALPFYMGSTAATYHWSSNTCLDWIPWQLKSVLPSNGSSGHSLVDVAIPRSTGTILARLGTDHVTSHQTTVWDGRYEYYSIIIKERVTLCTWQVQVKLLSETFFFHSIEDNVAVLVNKQTMRYNQGHDILDESLYKNLK